MEETEPAATPARAPGETAQGRLILRRNQDRRVRAGHPWVFSNEVAAVEGEPADGALVEIADARGAYLGLGYVNRHSLIRARVLTRGRDRIDADFFAARIARALRLREAAMPGERTLRVVYGEADLLPGLIVDRYDDWLAVQILTLGLEVRAAAIRAALERVLAPRGAVRACDAPVRTLEGLPLERAVWWGEVPERVEVEVEGLRVEADLLGGQKTGLFLDQRPNRRLVEARAAGRRVLDLFCFQGEWAMHAARGGAAEVVAYDTSAPALEAAARNLARNDLTGAVRLERGDAFEALRAFERAGERFGLVILDPPALVKSGRHLAAGARAYRDLNRLAMSALQEEGFLLTCSCSHHLDDALFRQVLVEAARAAKRPFRIVEWTGAGPDHPWLLAVPETRYLKCALLQAL